MIKWKRPDANLESIHAVIVNHEIFRNMVGMSGILIASFMFESKKYYVLKADNYGPKVNGFLLWMPGNIMYVRRTHISLY